MSLVMKEFHLVKYIGKGFEVEWEGKMVTPEVEVKVSSGKCKVEDELENGSIKVSCTPSCSEYGVSGYITKDTDLGKIILQAIDLNQPLLMRFEKKRKKHIDPTIPIEDLKAPLRKARESLSNIVAGIYDFNTNTWIMNRQSHVDPSQDPEYYVPLKDLFKEEKDVDVDEFFNTKRVESTPNSERACHLIIFAANVIKFAKREEIDLPMEIAQKLAQHLLSVSDNLQMSMFGISAPNYKDFSHTRARSLVFQYMEIYNIPFKSLKTDFPKWKANCQKWGEDMWEWASTIDQN